MITKSNLDWNKFKVFYHIAKAGSFTEASHVMHITQSALSRSIQKLEEQIQIKLFVRNSRGVILTSQGQALFDSVQKMNEEFIQCNKEIEEVKDEAKGSLKIGLLRRLSSSALLQHILDFQKTYSDIKLNIIQYDKVEDFKNLGVEIAIMPAFANSSELLQIPLQNLEQKLFASSDYITTYGLPQTLDALKSHRLIDFNEQDRFFQTSVALYVNSYEDMYRAVEQGLGIALLNTEVSKASLVEVLPEVVRQQHDLHCIYPAYLKKFKRVELFENHLKQALQSQEMLGNQNNDSLLSYKDSKMVA